MVSSVLERVMPSRAKTEFELLAPDAEGRQVRWFRLVVGSLVVAVAAIAGWLLVQSQSTEVQVWVARDRIEAGSVLAASDLALRSVSAGSELGAIDGAQELAGRSVRLSIPAGSALVPGHLFDGDDVLASGAAAEMSLIFSAGRITDSVERNDLLRIAVVLNEGGELVIFDQVPVVSVGSQERGTTMVSIEVSVEESDRLVSALADADSFWATAVGRR